MSFTPTLAKILHHNEITVLLDDGDNAYLHPDKFCLDYIKEKYPEALL